LTKKNDVTAELEFSEKVWVQPAALKETRWQRFRQFLNDFRIDFLSDNLRFSL